MKNNRIKVTNPDKILFSENNLKKIDLIKYYAEMCELMFPFLKDRPLSVVRCHEADGENSFFKRHPTGKTSLETVFNMNGEEYFYLSDKFQIVAQAQFGTIEFHPWANTVNKMDYPSIMVFDLDPDENLPLNKLADAVKVVKNFLDEINLISFLKTSGKKGYHIIIPFEPACNYDKFSEFSKSVADILTKKYPLLFTNNIKKDKRKGKIFIDYLRNNRMSTCVAPFSARTGSKGAVSMPISWDKLGKIAPDEINIKNYKKYLNSAWNNFFKVHQKINF